METKTKIAIATLLITAIGTIGGLLVAMKEKDAPVPIHIEQTIQGGQPGSTVSKTINIGGVE